MDKSSNETIIPKIKPIQVVGAGAFGYVIEAYDQNIEQIVAVKRTHKVGKQLSREHQILKLLKDNENIINLYDTFYTTDENGHIIQNCEFEFLKRKKNIIFI